MPRPRFVVKVCTVVCVVAAALPACGAVSQETSGESVLKTVQTNKVMRGGVAPAPPYSKVNADTGQWEGVVIDFANRWASSLGARPEYIGTSYGVIVAGLQAGRFDVVPALNDTQERRSAVTFSEPVVTAISVAAVVADRDRIDSWESLTTASNTICTVSGSSDDATLTKANPVAQILRLADLNACRLALQSQRANAVFDEWHSQGEYASQANGVRIVFPPNVLGQQGVSAALSQSATADDLAALNTAIEDFRSSGELAESLTKWGAVNPLEFSIGPVPDYARQLADTEFSA